MREAKIEPFPTLDPIPSNPKRNAKPFPGKPLSSNDIANASFKNSMGPLQLNVERSMKVSSNNKFNLPGKSPKDMNHFELCQSTWRAFSMMTDSQRNSFLKGLLSRFSSCQVDYICSALNLRNSGSESMTPMMHPAEAHSRLVRSTPKKIGGARGRSSERTERTVRSRSPGPTDDKKDRQQEDFDDQQDETHGSSHGASKLVNTNMYIKLANVGCDYSTLVRQLEDAGPQTVKQVSGFLSGRVSKLQTIVSCIEYIASESDIDKVVKYVLDCALAVTEAKYGSLYFLADSGTSLSVKKSNWLEEGKVFPPPSIVGGQSLVNGDSLNVYNIKATEFYDASMDDFYRFDLSCFLSGPIYVGGSLSAIIEVANKTSGSPFFNAEDEAMLKAIISLWAMVLHSPEIQLDTGRKADDIAGLLTTASMMSSERSLGDLIQTIMQQARELLNAERCTLFMVDKERQELWSTLAQGSGEIRIPLGKGIAGAVATTGQVLNIKNAYEDPRFNREVDYKSGFVTRNILAYPLHNAKGEVIGVTQVINKLPKERRFNREDELLLSAFSALASVTIEKSVHFGALQLKLDSATKMKDYALAILSSLDGIAIILDEQGHISKINHPDRLHISTDKIRTKPFVEWLGPDNLSLVQDLNRTYSSGSNVFLPEYELGLPNGKIVVNYTITPLTLMDENGKPVTKGVVVMLEEITAEKRMKQILRRKFAPNTIEKITEQKNTPALDAQLQDVTVLLTDIRNYTSFAEFKEPSATISILNEYYANMATSIAAEGGILDKCMGDRAMGVFGVPFEGPADPNSAVCCAVQMKELLETGNKTKRAAGVPVYKIGIGIVTGPVCIGTLGPPSAPDYTIVGEPVGLAEKIQKAAKEYGCTILICDRTKQEIKDLFHLREVDRISSTKAGSQPITIFEVLCRSSVELETDKETALICFELGLAEYRQQNWEAALSNFARATQLLEDGPSRVFIDRCKLLVDHRVKYSESWDGVYRRPGI